MTRLVGQMQLLDETWNIRTNTGESKEEISCELREGEPSVFRHREGRQKISRQLQFAILGFSLQ